MALTPSTMLPLGTKAPAFRLPEPLTGRTVSLDDFRGAPGLLVMFICNHCPYVKHLQRELACIVDGYKSKGLAVVGINSNDAENYPDDSPTRMAEEAKRTPYTFPYLFDESQEVAKAFQAACTPDFFLFDKELKLAYRGQFDESRPGNSTPITGKDLSLAVENVLNGRLVPFAQKPSIGCNIKWKA